LGLWAKDILGILLLVSSCMPCATEAADSAATTEPTVDVFWAGIFLVLFLGICAWFVVAIWRAERQNRAK
jgi:heme/copper-type cytochrome/quinol oxidase subunit 2